LIGTGRLRRKVANSIVVADWNRIKLLVDLIYAAAHNEGTRNIPQRQYMGQTKELTKMQGELIEKQFKKIWE
jgi:phage gpG-like protein